MTWADMHRAIMARFDEVNARLTDIDGRLVTIEDRTGEMAGAIEKIKANTETLREGLEGLSNKIDELDVSYALDELVDAERRRELNGMRDELRARRVG